MTKSHRIQVKNHLKSGKESPARLRNFLRTVHPKKTAESIAADTGLSVNTVASWLKGLSSPNFSACMTLIDVYGAELLADILPRSAGWLAEPVREAKRDRLSDDMEALRVRMEALR